MKRKSIFKRVGIALSGIAVAGMMFSTNALHGVQEVKADMRVFDRITERYPASDTDTVLKILEITSSESEVTLYGNGGNIGKTNSYAELGYYLPIFDRRTEANFAVTAASQGAAVTSPEGVAGGYIMPNGSKMNSPEAVYPLYYLRNFGIIPDSNPANLGDYPIKTTANAILFQTGNGATDHNYTPLSVAGLASYVKGLYTSVESGGEYNLADGYVLDDNHTICKEEWSEPAVSGNSVPEGETITVSENTIANGGVYELVDGETDLYHKKIKTPVTDDMLDTSVQQLPKGTDGTAYITRATDGNGNLKFEDTTNKLGVDPNFTLYFGVSDATTYYNTDQNLSFLNSNFFREYVLGSADKYKNSNIEYKCKGARTVTVADVESADLIYISTSRQMNDYIHFTSSVDISDEVMMAIYEKEVNDHKAVIMDYKCGRQDIKKNKVDPNVWEIECSKCNVWKLSRLLWQESQNAVANDFTDDFEVVTGADGNEIHLKDADLSADLIDHLQENLMSGYNGNFVTGNVYVYNHHQSDFQGSKALQDCTDIIANGDFNTPYVDEAATTGFAPVLGYIDTTNKNSTTGQMLSTVTPAVAIQYILISDGNPLTILKNTLNVLEIQPVASYLFNPPDSQNEEYGYLDEKYQGARDEFVEKYLGSYYDDKKEYINFISMSIDEFDGHNEDLIENYDIIYIGAGGEYDTTKKEINFEKFGQQFYLTKCRTKKTLAKAEGAYYLSSTSTNDKSMNIPFYRTGQGVNGRYYTGGTTDPEKNEQAYVNYAMLGNVYFTQGDYFEFNESRLNNFQTTSMARSRFGARDLNKTKLQKMKEFLEDGHLILCDPTLMTSVKMETEDSLTHDTVTNYWKQINPTAVAESEPGASAGLDDKGRIDDSSNMYELFQFALGNQFVVNATGTKGEYKPGPDDSGSGTSVTFPKYDNLISVKDIEYGRVEKAEVEKYIMKPRLSLTMTKVPTSYDYTVDGQGVIVNSSIQYLEQEANGDRNLVFGFIINSDISTGSSSNTYKPHLYIDINNDGKFSKETEDILDIEIREKASGNEAPRDASNPSYYALSKDVEYEIKRAVDKEYSGYLYWKLAVDSNEVANAHTSESGCTVAKNITGKDEEVKILQLNRNSDQHLDLQSQNNNPSSKFGKYLKDVDGYDVYIKTITVSQFENDFEASYNAAHTADPTLTVAQYAPTYFDSYVIKAETSAGAGDAVIGANMLVLGFGDNYDNFEKDTSLKAVQAYIEQGNPVLMTHDFIMFNCAYRQANGLRDLVGMDKYGVTDNITADGTLYNKDAGLGGNDWLRTATNYSRGANSDVFKAMEASGKAVAYEPGGDRNQISVYRQGLSHLIISRYRWGDWSSKRGLHNFINKGQLVESGGANNNATFYVDKLNDGQLTSFPYELPDKFQVSDTHTQYFELDMDADDDHDGESDTVVWYTLGDSGKGTGTPNPFRADGAPKSAAHAYYIYNKGNVTYTGSGHSNVLNGSEYEAQLFVNTLFAAYKSKYVSPNTGFYETADLNAPAINNVPVPYDGNVTKPEPGDTTSVDSSILDDPDAPGYKYKFVDPNANATYLPSGSEMYFRLADNNFVRGTKSIGVKVWLQTSGMEKLVTYDSDGKMQAIDPSGNASTYTCSNGSTANIEIKEIKSKSVPMIDITDKINLYATASGGAFDHILTFNDTAKKYEGLVSGLTYGFYLPMWYLNNNASYTLYFETDTTVYTVSAMTGQSTEQKVVEHGWDDLTVTKASLLRLN